MTIGVVTAFGKEPDLFQLIAQEQGRAEHLSAGLATGIAATLDKTQVGHLQLLLDLEDRTSVFEL